MSESNSAVLEAPSASADTVAVGIDDLLIGRPIQFPIFDDNGLLLLAEGAIITSDFKRLLRQRKLPEVKVHKDDVANITLNTDILAGVEEFSFDNAITQQLDKLVEGGLPPLQNNGPAVKDSMVSLGRIAYDNKQRERLVERNKENGKALNNMLDDALNGGRLDGAVATQMAGAYLNEMRADVENVLTSAVGVFDDDCMSHQALQTSMLAMALGIELGFDTSNVRTLGLIGLVHDWGMMKVPTRIRQSQTPLTAEQFHEVKKHPIYSLELLDRATSIPGIVSLVSYQIHERPCGTGYPRGRSGNAIHQFARVIAVADAYTAMTTARKWRPAFMAYAAVETLVRDAGKKMFDPVAVRALLNVLALFPIGSLVTLSDGSIGRVMRRNGKNYTKPIVQRLQDGSGRRVDSTAADNILDLSQSELSVEQALPTPGRDELSLSEALKLTDSSTW